MEKPSLNTLIKYKTLYFPYHRYFTNLFYIEDYTKNIIRKFYNKYILNNNDMIFIFEEKACSKNYKTYTSLKNLFLDN